LQLFFTARRNSWFDPEGFPEHRRRSAALASLARAVSAYPGRKNLLWLSAEFPVRFSPDFLPKSQAGEESAGGFQRSSHAQDLRAKAPPVRATAALLTASQVAVYPILATGLNVYPEHDPSQIGSPITEGGASLVSSQVSMETLAHDTGGKAFYGTNGLDDAMARAVDEGSHYYTLAYTPSNAKRDGKYRRVELKITDGSYNLAYRHGYYAENANFAQGTDAKKNDNLVPLMAFGMPDFDQILYKVQLTRAKPESSAAVAGSNTELKMPRIRCTVDFAVSLQDLKFEIGADGMQRGNIEVMLVAYNRDGKLLNSFRKKSEIALPQQAYAEVLRVGLQMRREIDVPEGEALLRVGIYDVNSGKAGTLEISLGPDK